MKKIVIIIVILTATFILISGMMSKIIYDRSFPRFEVPNQALSAMLFHEDITYTHEPVEFMSNDHTLQGYWYHQETAEDLVVIVHGLGGGAESYLSQALWFLNQGYGVFMYDATGSFHSEGKSTKGFPQSLLDLDAALTMIKNHDTLSTFNLFVFGHSWGGYAAINILDKHDDIVAVMSASAPANANEMIYEQAHHALGFFSHTQRPFLSLYQRYLFGELASLDGIDVINQSSTHVLLIHGQDDQLIQLNQSAAAGQTDKITRDNVERYIIDEAGRNNHDNIFLSQAAINYINAVNEDYRALYNEHNEAIPLDIDEAFYAEIDRFLFNEVDEALMLKIHDFFMQAKTNS